MPEPCSFRQVDEKHVAGDVAHMAWSPKMDLMAIAITSGEVILYRLSMQKVWNLSQPNDEAMVTALAWRPDGKVLAVGYDDGSLILCDVENADILHAVEDPDRVTCLQWIQEMPRAGGGQREDRPEDKVFDERCAEFLPKLPALNKDYSAIKGQTDENVEDPKRLKDQKDLNILVVGSEGGRVRLLVYGLFNVARVDLASYCGVSRVLEALLSSDLHLLSVVLETDDLQLRLVTFDTSLLSKRRAELCTMAHKYGQISSLLGYLTSTLKQMEEAWEDILLEMDTKLVKFANEKRKSSGTVCNDFMELLLFGTPSEELSDFLLRDLTDKGLKKLGHSIETSYTNVQRLVLKQVHLCAQALIYHLGDLRAMACWEEKFGILGLDERRLTAAIKCVGSFMLKAGELQHVIDNSLKNFKAFFRWLYVAILRLSNEAIPPELSKCSQQTYNFVAEFLCENFTLQEAEGAESHGFRLERVGQYLKKKPLYSQPSNENQDWFQFLAENPAVSESGLLYPLEREKSLTQVHALMEEAIKHSMDKPMSTVSQHFQLTTNCQLRGSGRTDGAGERPRIAQFSVCTEDNGNMYTLCMPDPTPADSLYLVSHQTRCSNDDDAAATGFKVSRFRFGELGDGNGIADRCKEHRVLDIAFYDSRTISVLLLETNEDGLPLLVQVTLSAILQLEMSGVTPGTSRIELKSLPLVDIGPHLHGVNCRKLENMKASALAVSGTRKVASVLFSSRRRVRLFLMDVDDDDEEEGNETDADTTAHSGMDDSQNNATDRSGNGEDKENTSFNSGDASV